MAKMNSKQLFIQELIRFYKYIRFSSEFCTSIQLIFAGC